MPGLFSRKGLSARRPFCCAVILAAGSSVRMGEDKMKIRLGRASVIAHTLCAVERCESVDEIVVVTRQESVVDVAGICRDYGIIKATKIVAGGQTRLESALIGVSQASSETKLIAIHDGARPLVTEDVVNEAVACAARYLAAVPALPVTDTIKITRDGAVCGCPPRDSLAAAQTPQVFEVDLIKAALASAYENGLEIPDDSAAVEAFGVMPKITRGSPENIKITTPLDILIAEMILKSRAEGEE